MGCCQSINVKETSRVNRTRQEGPDLDQSQSSESGNKGSEEITFTIKDIGGGNLTKSRQSKANNDIISHYSSESEKKSKEYVRSLHKQIIWRKQNKVDNILDEFVLEMITTDEQQIVQFVHDLLSEGLRT